MTRAEEPAAGIERRVFGAAGAERTVIVLRTGPAATLDPEPAGTAARAVRVVAIGLREADLEDPATFGGQTEAETAAGVLTAMARELAGESNVGLVGVGATGLLAVLLAAELGDAVDRLALIAVPAPDQPIDRDDEEEVMARVTAKTLIMNGQRDPEAGAAAARWHHDHLAGSRVEMVPGALVPAPDDRLALADVWDRVLSHVAPGTKSPS
jgi:pimeloyl-ACP methyl ester carboxylesterase